jgi:hypothetical protein
MRHALALLALSLASPLMAHDETTVHDHELVITRASQLVPWCRAEAEAYFVGQGASVYQWTASYRDSGNTLHVDGKLRVDGKDVTVGCRIARGARERYATIEIHDAP